MNINLIKKYKFNPDLIYRRVGETAMVFNKDNGDMYEFNDVGADIIELLKDEIPVSDVLLKLSLEYSVEESEIHNDVSIFLKRIIELGIILIG